MSPHAVFASINTPLASEPQSKNVYWSFYLYVIKTCILTLPIFVLGSVCVNVVVRVSADDVFINYVVVFAVVDSVTTLNCAEKFHNNEI